MLQAWISSPRGSLYFAAHATPYNLEHLRAHVRALHRLSGQRACLAVSLGEAADAEVVAKVVALVDEATREGIQVRFEGAGRDTPPARATRRVSQRRSRILASPRRQAHARG